ncbi:MAG: PD40 domain-containing protein [Flavobacteriales bacterium]|nr:PD40 domain-containing protein [Flavobacteriales bacterium]NDG52630.1 hypothetical protein [Flavobacteriia bacterium]
MFSKDGITVVFTSTIIDKTFGKNNIFI